MSTRGFEFAYMFDGSDATPIVRDFVLHAAAAHKSGDLMVIDSDGELTQATGTATEVAAVCQETVAAAAITAGTTKAKMAILTRNQVWRCSCDDTHTTWVVGYTKAGDITDCNTLDHDNVDHGPCCCVDNTALLDDEGKQVNYVCFLDTTFGNT